MARFCPGRYANMIFYALIFILAFFLFALCQRRGVNWAYWAGVSVLFLLSAMRFDVGQDFYQFYTIEVPPWDELSIIASARDFDRFGLSVKLLYLISEWIGWRQLIFVVTSGLIYFSFGIGIRRHSENVILSWAFFVGFMMVQSFNMIWQMSAMGIVFLSLDAVLKKRPCKFLLLILLAVSFHTSAIVALLIYPVYHWMSWRWIVVSGCVMVGCVQSLLSIISSFGLYASYLEELDKYPGGEKLMYLYPVLMASLVVFGRLFASPNADDVDAKHSMLEIRKLLAVVLVGVFPPFYFGASLGNRVGFYFLIFLLVYAPSALRNVRFVGFLYSCSFVAFFFVTVHLSQHSPVLVDTHVPYRCFLFTDTSYLRER